MPNPNVRDKSGWTALDHVLRPEYDCPVRAAEDISKLLRDAGARATSEHDRDLHRERQYGLSAHLERASYFGDVDYRLAIQDVTAPFPSVADAFEALRQRDRDALSKEERVFVDGYPRYLKHWGLCRDQ